MIQLAQTLGPNREHCVTRSWWPMMAASFDARTEPAISVRYPTRADALPADTAALRTTWEAHTAVRCRCRQGECEARRILEDALEGLEKLLKTAGN